MLKQHPLSAAFPAMPEDEFSALVEDIKTNGLREPIVIFEHKILDGWHRFRACEKAGIPCKTLQLPVTKDPVAYVLSRNLHRRHLSGSQRAGAVVACSTWAQRGANQHRGSAPGAEAPTVAEMARAADVSPRTIEQAKRAHEAGLGDAVKDGALTAKQAAEVARGEQPKPKKPSPLELENERLKDDIAQLRENLPELTAMASAAEAIKNDEHFKKIVHLEAELTAVKKRRDDLMRENAELKTQVSYWKKQAGKKAA